jgi:uncharacterized membrane protein
METSIAAKKPRHFRLTPVELVFLISSLVLGSIMIVMTPVGAGFDEDQHLTRVWQESGFLWVPRELSARNARFPDIYFELSYRKQVLVEPVGPDYWSKYGSAKLYEYGIYNGPVRTRSNYSPILLLPQALTMRYLGRAADLPALPVYYATRFMGLLSYVLLGWLAIRIIPFGKWILLILALAPTAIYQAATISADTISNGIGLLFIAGVLALERRASLGWKDLSKLALLFALLFSTKPNLFPLALLPFLVLRPGQFSRKGFYFLMAAMSAVIFAIIALGWNIISPNQGLEASEGVDAAGQMRFILEHPLEFTGIILRDLVVQAPKHLTRWIGVYGYAYGSVPWLTYPLFAAGLVLAVLAKTEEPAPTRRVRLAMLALSVISYLMTMIALYLTFTRVGESFVYGVQGRYFIAIFPLLFLACFKLPALERWGSSPRTGAWFGGVAALCFIAGLIMSYHVECGESYYNFGLCYQPNYKNFAPLLRSTTPISSETTLIQEFRAVCADMKRVQVRVNSIAGQGGQTTFSVQDNQTGKSLFTETVKNGSLPTDGWYGMDFQPIAESEGRLYTISMQGAGTPAGQGPLLALSVRPEYPQGQFLQNEAPSEDDIIFQYGCLVGLEKIRPGAD